MNKRQKLESAFAALENEKERLTDQAYKTIIEAIGDQLTGGATDKSLYQIKMLFAKPKVDKTDITVDIAIKEFLCPLSEFDYNKYKNEWTGVNCDLCEVFTNILGFSPNPFNEDTHYNTHCIDDEEYLLNISSVLLEIKPWIAKPAQ